MTSATEILTREFEALKTELIAAYDEKGMRASGNWPESLEVVISDNKAQLFGADYSQQLDGGRSPGKQPPSSVIEQWLIDKGIAARLERNISISSLAFIIARKIGREGWKREQYGGVDLIKEVVTPERIQTIIDKLSDVYTVNFTNEIISYLQAA